MGVVKQVVFTPVADGRLKIICRYEMAVVAGSDWGVGVTSRCFMTQDGSTTLGDPGGASTTRGVQVVQYTFDVTAGSEVQCGLYASLSGAVSANYWNVSVSAELRKR